MTDQERAVRFLIDQANAPRGPVADLLAAQLVAEFTAVRLDERRAIARLLRATAKDRIDGHVILRHLADQIARGEHEGVL